MFYDIPELQIPKCVWMFCWKFEIESSSLIIYIQASVFDSESFKLGVQRIIKLLPLCSLGGPAGDQIPLGQILLDHVWETRWTIITIIIQWMCIALN